MARTKNLGGRSRRRRKTDRVHNVVPDQGPSLGQFNDGPGPKSNAISSGATVVIPAVSSDSRKSAIDEFLASQVDNGLAAPARNTPENELDGFYPPNITLAAYTSPPSPISKNRDIGAAAVCSLTSAEREAEYQLDIRDSEGKVQLESSEYPSNSLQELSFVDIMGKPSPSALSPCNSQVEADNISLQSECNYSSQLESQLPILEFGSPVIGKLLGIIGKEHWSNILGWARYPQRCRDECEQRWSSFHMRQMTSNSDSRVFAKGSNRRQDALVQLGNICGEIPSLAEVSEQEYRDFFAFRKRRLNSAINVVNESINNLEGLINRLGVQFIKCDMEIARYAFPLLIAHLHSVYKTGNVTSKPKTFEYGVSTAKLMLHIAMWLERLVQLQVLAVRRLRQSRARNPSSQRDGKNGDKFLKNRWEEIQTLDNLVIQLRTSLHSRIKDALNKPKRDAAAKFRQMRVEQNQKRKAEQYQLKVEVHNTRFAQTLRKKIQESSWWVSTSGGHDNQDYLIASKQQHAIIRSNQYNQKFRSLGSHGDKPSGSSICSWLDDMEQADAPESQDTTEHILKVELRDEDKKYILSHIRSGVCDMAMLRRETMKPESMILEWIEICKLGMKDWCDVNKKPYPQWVRG